LYPYIFFGTFVPTYDGAVQSFPNDGIVGSLDDSGEVQRFGPLALDVPNGAQNQCLHADFQEA
jgi:hypothetical protein